MRRNQLLDLANAQGLEVSSNMLRRYVQYGLIVTKRIGKGPKGGVSAEYPDSLEALKEVKRLSELGDFKQSDSIFILFSKGYPVQWDKLKEQMIDYIKELIRHFNVISNLSSNNHDKLIGIVEDLAEKSIPIKKPGRPSKRKVVAEKEYMKRQMEQMLLITKLITDLTKQNTITFQTFTSFITQFSFQSQTDLEKMYQQSFGKIDLKAMMNIIQVSKEKDYAECLVLMNSVKRYWNELKSTFSNANEIPIIGVFIEELLRIFDGKSSDNPNVIKVFLFITLFFTQEKRTQLILFLSSPETMKTWHEFCRQLYCAYSTQIGKEVNP
ncbi:hypothetical protein AV654_22630 [Paenibacillus elgii]|uniref:Uncharacterized protein n=1 Tax=Paenibacillus elgii TaxID=189691 RepID=A0A163WZM3_9BACL|nr:hypothetical protein [Paenibacillus elgii]KZE77086.1 hypothetical protein AV654_22630 [Paenibacillus elgii]